MQLVGMYDSPYVRRVAVSMRLLDIPFEHANWSIGRDRARIEALNPLGQVPTLVLDDGEVLIDSIAIIDYLDDRVGPARALTPATGEPRRRTLYLAALAMGIADKARQQASERIFRPRAMRNEPLVDRWRAQMIAACTTLEAASAVRGDAPFLVGDAITQADIALVCALTNITEAVGLTAEEAPLPTLRARHERLSAQSAFQEIYLPFDPPVVD